MSLEENTIETETETVEEAPQETMRQMHERLGRRIPRTTLNLHKREWAQLQRVAKANNQKICPFVRDIIMTACAEFEEAE